MYDLTMSKFSGHNSGKYDTLLCTVVHLVPYTWVVMKGSHP